MQASYPRQLPLRIAFQRFALGTQQGSSIVRLWHFLLYRTLCIQPVDGQIRVRTFTSMLVIFKSPPKYRAYSLLIGRPTPYPAITLGESAPCIASSIRERGDTEVVYRYVQMRGIPLLLIPPPSSATCKSRQYGLTSCIRVQFERISSRRVASID